MNPPRYRWNYPELDALPRVVLWIVLIELAVFLVWKAAQ